MRVLETERLIIKSVEEEDLLKLLDLQWDKNVVKYMKFNPLTIDNQKIWFKSLGKTSLAFTINSKIEDGTLFLGMASLNNIDHLNQRASWGMKLISNLQGKGIGFEASLIIMHYGFHYLNFRKIYADFFEENIASEKLTTKIGLRTEGKLIDHYFQNGKFQNLVLVGILKEEFYEKNLKVLKSLGLLEENN